MPGVSVIPRSEHRPDAADVLADRPIVLLTAVQYDDCLAGRTRRLAECLARLGHDVTFVEMPSVRSSARRLTRSRSGRSCAGVRVCSVPPLPLHSVLHDSALGRRWVRVVARRLGACVPGLERGVAVCSTPWWLPVLQRLPVERLVYDCIDHVEVHSGRRLAWLYGEWERRVLARADGIVTVGPHLRERVRSSGAVPEGTPVVVVPNGVPQGWVEGPAPEPPGELVEWAGKARVVGFVGAVFEWVDQRLIRRAAELLPDHRFFVVGPTRLGVPTDALRGPENLRLFPPVPFERVPAWIAGADVCLLPFNRSRVTRLADPIKVYEYLALGKPVVSSIECPARVGAAPVTVTDDPREFASAIRRSWQEDTPALRAARREFARANTWESRALDVRRVLAEAVVR